MTDFSLAQEDPFEPPLATDPDTIREEQHRTLQLIRPDWRPVPGALDTHLLATTAETTAETRQALSDRLRSELLTLIGGLFGLPRQDGVPAGSTITIIAIDETGHTVPTGTTVFLGDIELETLDTLTIPAGSSSGSAAIAAIDPGADANDADGTPDLDPFDWIASVTLDAPLTGGVDPEDDAEYSGRLAEELQTLSPAVIHPLDAAIRARRNPAVGWAYAINLYDSTTDTSNVERAFSVVIARPDGTAVSQTIIDEVLDDLQSARETNFIIRVTNPTYTSIAVVTTVVPLTGWDPLVVEQNVVDRLTEVLSPAGWLPPPFGIEPGYVPQRRVHSNELIARVDTAHGVDYVESLTVDAGSGPVAFYDLATPVHLPQAGAITVTVT